MRFAICDRPHAGPRYLFLPAAIERVIHRLSEELEVTSLLVTHDIEGGLEMCDRVAIMVRGKLALWEAADQIDISSFERLYLEAVEQGGKN